MLQLDIGHNPYFNRWFSAMWETMGNRIKYDSHNPYFNRWFSAINHKPQTIYTTKHVTILILIDGFLQYDY